MNLPPQLVAFNPLEYPGWDSLLATHPEGTFFQTAGWARVLVDTYGHRPAYFCRVQGNQLLELLPAMEVATALRKPRGVSLPFSDFCAPLGSGSAEVFEKTLQHGAQRHWQFLECRGACPGWRNATPSVAFFEHVIPLETGLESVYQQFDSSVRRGIKKATSAELVVRFDTDAQSIRTYYSLHCRTRQRHGLPPQPVRFFENIARHILASGNGFIATAWSGSQPVASTVFFKYRQQALYKYGASDFRFQHLRPNSFLMWEAIKHSDQLGCSTVHLGRTSTYNDGLRRFKLGFGARENRLEYFKYRFADQSFVTDVDRAESWFNRVFRRLPLSVLRMAGELLYPHLS